MPVFSFRTISAPSEGSYKEKGSKFLSFAYPVQTEADVKVHLASLRKQYFDARHHCFAFMLGADKSRFRVFDDGEPNHSAGDPILGQIRSKDITNVLVVVVRYFGGVKLGVGGLISAYKAAAEDALNKAVIFEKDVLEAITMRYPYTSTPEVMKLVKDFELSIREQSFEYDCVIEVQYSVRHRTKLMEKIALLTATGHSIQIVNRT